MGRPMTKLEEDLTRKLCDWQDKCQALKERIIELEAENKQLKKQIGDLRADAVRKGLMRGGSFTGKG